MLVAGRCCLFHGGRSFCCGVVWFLRGLLLSREVALLSKMALLSRAWRCRGCCGLGPSVMGKKGPMPGAAFQSVLLSSRRCSLQEEVFKLWPQLAHVQAPVTVPV